jgi:hypothetical protein
MGREATEALDAPVRATLAAGITAETPLQPCTAKGARINTANQGARLMASGLLP